jgi:hypothetical protein
MFCDAAKKAGGASAASQAGLALCEGAALG